MPEEPVVTVEDLGPLITIGVEDLGGIEVDATTPVVSGPRGESAYQVAVDQGFVGTVEEWLASLRGEDGDDGAGAVVSVNGHDGVVVLHAGDVGADPTGTAQQLVDDLWTQIAGGNLDAALDTLKEIGDRLAAGDDAAAALAAQIAAVSATLSALSGVVAGKADTSAVTAVSGALTAHKASGDHDTHTDARYYTKTQTDDAISAHVPDLSGYATTTAMNDGLNFVLSAAAAVSDAVTALTARVAAIEDLPRVLGAGATVPDGTGFDVDDFYYDTSTE